MDVNWRDELNCRSYGLDHKRPKDFYVSRWQKRKSISSWYVGYRMILAFWSFGVLVSSFVEGRYKETQFLLDTDQGFLKFWPIYLTNWGFLCLTLQLVLSAVVIVEKLLEKPVRLRGSLTVLQRILWLLYTVTTTVGLFISITFWTQIYSPERHLSAQSILTHGLNSFVILVDVFVSARPWRLAHFYQPFAMLTMFVLFSLVYWISGGTNEHGKPCPRSCVVAAPVSGFPALAMVRQRPFRSAGLYRSAHIDSNETVTHQ